MEQYFFWMFFKFTDERFFFPLWNCIFLSYWVSKKWKCFLIEMRREPGWEKRWIKIAGEWCKGGFVGVLPRDRANFLRILKGDVNCPFWDCWKRNWPFPKKIDVKVTSSFCSLFSVLIFVVSGATVVHRMHCVSKTFALLKILAHTTR